MEKTLHTQLAFPCDGKYSGEARNRNDAGLTKREYFAAMAMQSFCQHPIVRIGFLKRLRLFFFGETANVPITVSYGDPNEVAIASLKQADALIEALNNEGGQS